MHPLCVSTSLEKEHAVRVILCLGKKELQDDTQNHAWIEVSQKEKHQYGILTHIYGI